MALYFADPTRPSPVTPEFDITQGQRPEVSHLAEALRAVIDARKASREVALAAILELGVQLAEPAPVVASLAASRALRKRQAS
jgi:hypothetical protein